MDAARRQLPLSEDIGLPLPVFEGVPDTEDMLVDGPASPSQNLPQINRGARISVFASPPTAWEPTNGPIPSLNAQYGAFYNITTSFADDNFGGGFFRNAHDFVINNSTFISQIIHAGSSVFHILSVKRMAGAEVNSAARDPAPRCHPETRKTTRDHISKWLLRAPGNHWRMLWLLGPAGTGKSALAQTIAEEMIIQGRLGAALFLSRSNHNDDPDCVFPTLAHQLARRLPAYKHIISRRLADDPTILEKNRRAQFKDLIIEPFHFLMTQRPETLPEPLLIIIDGLDECNSADAQCDFLDMINDHVRTVPMFPLLWLICSRPEWHFTYLFTDPDFPATCKRENLRVDDEEAQQDVVRVLHEKFAHISHRYQHQLDPAWPPQSALRSIAAIAKGMFAVSETIIRFVGDEVAGNPSGRLQVCLKYLDGFTSLSEMHPLHALDLLYREIMARIPADILQTTRRILGLELLYGTTYFGAVIQANLLQLSQEAYYNSLKHLASVLWIPPPSHSTSLSMVRIKFYHASFGDFLRDPRRSREYAVDEAAVHLDVVVNSLQWNSIEPRLLPRHLTWKPSFASFAHLDLIIFTNQQGLIACTNLKGDDVQKVKHILADYCFEFVSFIDKHATTFIPWLFSVDPSLVHVELGRKAVSPVGHGKHTFIKTNATEYEYLSRLVHILPDGSTRLIVCLGPRRKVTRVSISFYFKA
ncbi:hypothetical protein D9756_007198 [Leucocoprinus leucothites]|uniref:NACHT domain-containing protein n=1 Tax=Leucocoprinus leucothites TaxID=201217 RepID=A0A8H5FZD3_9AGAR|nr:hypothetical protein D9756_007198 [Leucoagaricus leucothites]